MMTTFHPPASAPWWSNYRTVGHVRVLHVDLVPDDDREAEAAQWLDAEELARMNRFKVARPRTQYVLCRSALRACLCYTLGCGNSDLSFGYGEFGKPFAIVSGRQDPVSFNVTHSGQHGLIAVSKSCRLGVDAEIRRDNRDFDGIGEKVYGENERSALKVCAGAAKSRMFYRLWAMKEALIKAIGTGFSLNPSRFEIPAEMLRDARAGLFRFPHEPACAWHLENLGEERFAAAVAFELPSDTPV